MFSKLGRPARAIALAASIALVPTAGLVALAPAAYAEGGKEWTGEGDGHSWNDDNNWAGNEAPKDGDGVTIQAPDSKGGSVHVTGAPSISLSDLTLSATAPNTVELDGGDISVSNSFSWNAGTLMANVSLGPLAHGTIGSGAKKFLYGDIDLEPGSGLLMSGVSGTSDLTIDDPHHIGVGTGAALATLGTNEIRALACCVHPAKIINNGIIEMGPGSLDLSTVEFDQFGQLDATFDPTLHVEKAPVNISSAARFSGTGHFTIGDNTITNVAGNIRVGGNYIVEQANGTLAGKAKLIGGGQWYFTGGTVYGTLTNQPGNLFSIQGAGPKSLGVLTGTQHGTLVNHGVLEASGGTVSVASGTRFRNEADGTMRFVPGLTVDGTSCCVSPGLVENHGDFSVTAPLTDGDNRPVTISHAGLYSDKNVLISSDQTLELASGPSQLTSPAVIGGGGTLSLGGGLVAGGNIAVQENSIVRLHDSADLTGDGLVLGGAGSTVNWAGGTLHGHVDFAAGTTVNVAVGGAKHIAAPNAGTTLVTTEGTTNVVAGADADHRNAIDIGSGQKWLNTGELTIAGNTAFTSGSCCVTPARLDNTGTIDFAPTAGTTVDVGGVEVHNSGGTVSAQSATTAIRYPSYVQDAGMLTVAGGATFGQTNSSSPIQLHGGTLTGTGTVTGTVQNDGGTVAPGSTAAAGTIGTLTVSGQYYQGPGGHLAVDIAKTTHDQVLVSGSARLAGVIDGVSKQRAVQGTTTATVLTAGTIAGVPDCTFATGVRTRGWTATTTTTALTLTSGPAAKTGCDVFTPLSPARAIANGTLVRAGHDVTIKLPGKAGVPFGSHADAVALTVTAADATDTGALSVAGSTGELLRYAPGANVSNAATLRLSPTGTIVLHASAGKVRAYLDVAGWYGDAQTEAGGDLYHAISPAVVDGPTVTAGTDVDVTVAGHGNIPDDDVDAVTLAVQVSDPTADGVLSVVSGGATVGNTVTQSYTTGKTANAVVTVPVSGGAVRLHLSAGSATVTVRSLGYFTPRTAGGSYFKGGVPTRVGSVLVDSTSSVAMNMLGRPGVPQFGAVSYLLGAHVSAPTKPATLSVGSAVTGAPLVPTVTVTTENRSGAAATTPDQNGAVRLKLGNGQATVLLDLLGYFVG